MIVTAIHSEYDIYDGYRHYHPLTFKINLANLSSEVTRVLEKISDQWSVDIGDKRGEILRFLIERDQYEIELLSKIDLNKLMRQTSCPTKYVESLKLRIEED